MVRARRVAKRETAYSLDPDLGARLCLERRPGRSRSDARRARRGRCPRHPGGDRRPARPRHAHSGPARHGMVAPVDEGPGAAHRPGSGRRASGCSCTGGRIRTWAASGTASRWRATPSTSCASRRSPPRSTRRSWRRRSTPPSSTPTSGWPTPSGRAWPTSSSPSKHHDGFAMYDSHVSDYNVVKVSAWKRDPMKDLKAAAQKHGIKFGFYYSQAWEWHHPDSPGNDWERENPGGDRRLFGQRWWETNPELVTKVRTVRRRQGHPPAEGADRQVRPGHHLVRHPGAAAARGEPAGAEGGARGQAHPGGQQPHLPAGASGPPGELRRLLLHHRQAGGVPAPPGEVPAPGRASPPPTSRTAGTRWIAPTSRRRTSSSCWPRPPPGAATCC